MYSRADFIRMANRSDAGFWAEVASIGSSWHVILMRLTYYRRCLTAYGKLCHGNGVADEIQMRALEHLNRASMRLWQDFRKAECKPYTVEIEKEKINKCGRHGDKLKCKAEYEALVGKYIFPR